VKVPSSRVGSERSISPVGVRAASNRAPARGVLSASRITPVNSADAGCAAEANQGAGRAAIATAASSLAIALRRVML
jgi:hypothetical protein